MHWQGRARTIIPPRPHIPVINGAKLLANEKEWVERRRRKKSKEKNVNVNTIKLNTYNFNRESLLFNHHRSALNTHSLTRSHIINIPANLTARSHKIHTFYIVCRIMYVWIDCNWFNMRLTLFTGNFYLFLYNICNICNTCMSLSLSISLCASVIFENGMNENRIEYECTTQAVAIA